MNKVKFKYEVNSNYKYNTKNILKFHSKIDEIRANYSRVMVIRINLFKVPHDPKLIDGLFDTLNSNRKFKDNLVFWSYVLEYKESAGEHYHFTFIFDLDTVFSSPAERSKYSLSPFNTGFHTMGLMKDYFSGKNIEADFDLSTYDNVKHLPNISIGIWNTNDQQKTKEVCYGLAYLYKTVEIKTGLNQKENVKIRKKVSFSKVYLHPTKTLTDTFDDGFSMQAA